MNSKNIQKLSIQRNNNIINKKIFKKNFKDFNKGLISFSEAQANLNKYGKKANFHKNKISRFISKIMKKNNLQNNENEQK